MPSSNALHSLWVLGRDSALVWRAMNQSARSRQIQGTDGLRTNRRRTSMTRHGRFASMRWRPERQRFPEVWYQREIQPSRIWPVASCVEKEGESPVDNWCRGATCGLFADRIRDIAAIQRQSKVAVNSMSSKPAPSCAILRTVRAAPHATLHPM